jgi:D-alanyl-D-alanine carboxypeptidase (penicillin-binding protein 5/6)
MTMKRCWLWVVVVVAVAGNLAAPAAAREARRHRAAKTSGRAAAPVTVRPLVPLVPPVGPYESALLIEAESGEVLFERNSTKLWPPASMVKMMVALVTLEAVHAGEISLEQPVRVSLAASRTGGTTALLRPGEVFTVAALLQAMLVASANDAAVAISEAVAGSTEAMIERMNRRVAELGMKDTIYRSVNGLPPRRGHGEPDVTSAVDLALLAQKLVRYPQVLQYAADPVISLRGGKTRLRNTNRLIGRMTGVDGLKTGYFRLAGFNLTATASRGGLRLITVVLGCPRLRDRFDVAQDLLEWGFANYTRLELVKAGEPLSIPVQVADGESTTLHPVAGGGSSVLVRRGESTDVQVHVQMPSVVTAPVAKDQPLGEIVIHDGDGVVDVIPAVSPLDVARSGADAAATTLSH